MASKIILKKSSVAAKAPVAGDLDFGELAINYTDSKLYFKKADGSIDAFTSAAASAPVTSVGGNIGDITDAQLLASIKNVDGTGSGLDADFLDGNHASDFYLASNPNGYTSNTGTVTSVGATTPLVSSGGTTPSLSIPAANSTTNGYMSSAYASKLDGIAAGATNVTNTNQLTNGAGYITSAPLANYLPLSGGTITGDIVSGNLNVGGVFGNLEIGYAGRYNTLQTKTNADTLWLQYAHSGPVGIAYGGGLTTVYGSLNTNGDLKVTGKILDGQDYIKSTSYDWCWLGRRYSGYSGDIRLNIASYFWNTTDSPVQTATVHTNSLSSVTYFGENIWGDVHNYRAIVETYIYVSKKFSVTNVTLNGDDPYALYINGQYIIGDDVCCSGKIYSHTFDVGWHHIEMIYSEGGGGHYVQLGWNPKDYTSNISAMTTTGPSVYVPFGSIPVHSTNVVNHALPIAGGSLTTGANNNIFIGRNSTATNYNAISLNGNSADSSNMGLTGGGSGDNTLYINSPGNIVLRTNSFGQSFTINSSGFTGNAASITNQANSATITASTGVNASQIVQRDSNGYIYANHVNFNTGVENPTIANFITDNGDGWSRKSSLAHVKNSIRGVADGTWGISITGNAATATYATSAGTADQIDGWAFRNTGNNSSVNADTLDSNGITYYTAGVTNFSGNSTDGALYSQAYSSSWQHQIAGDYRSGQIAVRGKNNGTWQSWYKVLQEDTWQGNKYFSSGGAIYGTIFYDSNDTTYYVDPNSTGTSLKLAGYGYFGLGIDGDGVVINHDQIWTPNGNFHIQYSGGGNVDMNNGGGYTFSRTSLRAPVFYDWNDTSYYIDPNSTANNALRMRGGAHFGPNTTWGASLYVGGDGRVGTEATVAVTNGNLHLDSKNGYQMYLNWYSTENIYTQGNLGVGAASASYRLHVHGTGYATSDFRAPIFYDANDTGYYVDPNSLSRTVAIAVENRVHITESRFLYMGGTATSENSWGSRDWTAGGHRYFNARSFTFNNEGYGSTYSFTIDTSGNAIATGSHRAPIFYDTDNTGYYLNPNSSSNLRGTLYVNGGHGDTQIRLTAIGGELGSGATSAMTWWVSEPGITWNEGGFGYNVTNDGGSPSGFSRLNTSYGQSYIRFTTDGNMQFYCTNTSGTRYDMLQLNSGNYIYAYNYLEAGSSLRAPIFYDSNNTGYYVDPNSTTRLNNLTVTGTVTGISGGQYFGTAATKAIAYNANSISENITVTTGNNGLSAGPITISSGFTVTVQSGAVWTVV